MAYGGLAVPQSAPDLEGVVERIARLKCAELGSALLTSEGYAQLADCERKKELNAPV